MALTREQRERLSRVRMFVLDMDGTIYLGERLFPFTVGFLQKVRNTGRDFCFFTNNSSKNREAYLEKLSRMGIPVPPEKMLISNGVILEWLKERHPGARCWVVGTPFLIMDVGLLTGGLPAGLFQLGMSVALLGLAVLSALGFYFTGKATVKAGRAIWRWIRRSFAKKGRVVA